jgi:hypothetical protein
MGLVVERPKYRFRTRLRELFPEELAARIPKGSQDCGLHEWYQAEDDHTWRCYHCVVGVTHTRPWDDGEQEARELDADAMLVRAGRRRRNREPVA